MQNLKSLLLSGCERKQKHQMAAEKTRDKESGWEVCNDTKPSSAELCQGSCSCLRAHTSEWGWEMGSPELDPCRRCSQSSQPVPQRMHQPGPADPVHCAVPSPCLAHPTEPSQEPLAGTSLSVRAQNSQGTKPSPVQVGCGEPRVGAQVGKVLEQLRVVGSDLPGAGSTHRAWHWGGSRAEKSTQHLAAPPWDGTANSILLRQQRP